LPALKAGAGSNNPPEYAPGEEHLQDEIKNGEPIAADKRMIAQPMIDSFSEPVIRKIFSRTWNLREEGIGEIEDQILDQQYSGDESEVFVNAIAVVRHTIGDKIMGVFSRSIAFLIKLTETIDPSLSQP
jgi:hypothetical protein